ncbi:MAG: biotin--[acetyl-CoA-carboxylase] ligase [Gemmatimonadota bacterium]
MIRWYDDVPSTQDIAHEMAQAGAPHGTAVAARAQHRGRGTRGRGWSSALGGLWLSLICRPRDRGAVETFGIRIGLALAAGIEAATDGLVEVAVKWPNDLYVRDRKLAGILCEARWQGDALAWIVVGLGVNVANRPPAGLAQSSISLGELGWAGTAEGLAEPLADRITVAGIRTDRLDQTELAAFAARDWLRDRRLAAPAAGIARGISPSGKLLIDGPLGPVEVLGSVVLADR